MLDAQNSQKPFVSDQLLIKDKNDEYYYISRIVFYLQNISGTSPTQTFNGRKYNIMIENVIYQLLSKLIKVSSNIKSFLLDCNINAIIQSRSLHFTEMLALLKKYNLKDNESNRQSLNEICFGNEIMSSEVTRASKTVTYKNIDDDEVTIDHTNTYFLKNNHADYLLDLQLRAIRSFVVFVQILVENFPTAENEIIRMEAINHGFSLFIHFVKEKRESRNKKIDYIKEAIKDEIIKI